MTAELAQKGSEKVNRSYSESKICTKQSDGGSMGNGKRRLILCHVQSKCPVKGSFGPKARS